MCIISFNFASYCGTEISLASKYLYSVGMLQTGVTLRGSLYYLTLTSSRNQKRFRTSKDVVTPFEMPHSLF